MFVSRFTPLKTGDGVSLEIFEITAKYKDAPVRQTSDLANSLPATKVASGQNRGPQPPALARLFHFELSTTQTLLRVHFDLFRLDSRLEI